MCGYGGSQIAGGVPDWEVDVVMAPEMILAVIVTTLLAVAAVLATVA